MAGIPNPDARERRLLDDADLFLELHAKPLVHRALAQLDQRDNIVERRRVLVHDEVRVQRAYHRAAMPGALQSTRFDQPPRMIPRRVLEHAAATVPLRLLLFPPL